MKVCYYPGCTLKTQAKNFEDSAVAAMAALGVEMEELKRWTCCGTVFPLATDSLINHLAPMRNLIRTKEQGGEKLVTLCSMCYNTLKRSNLYLKGDPEKLERLNGFMYEEETKYDGRIEVVHPLEILRDEIGFEALTEQVKVLLRGLKVAPYYGCLLLRPEGVGLDDREEPTILRDLIASLGAQAIDFPYKTECCGAFQTVNNVQLVAERTESIIGSAVRAGAEVVITSCPLCGFNLGRRQQDARRSFQNFRGIPVLYFTQLMALSLGLGERVCGFDLNYVDSRPLLIAKKLIAEG